MSLVEEIVQDVLRDSVAANERRIALRQRRREPKKEGCPHENWNAAKSWCEDCGVTLKELMTSLP